MNPLWFFIGLEIGDRLRDNEDVLRRLVPRRAKTFVREAFWWTQDQFEAQRLITAHDRFMREVESSGREGVS